MGNLSLLKKNFQIAPGFGFVISSVSKMRDPPPGGISKHGQNFTLNAKPEPNFFLCYALRAERNDVQLHYAEISCQGVRSGQKAGNCLGLGPIK